jgi:hypothetical protein
MRALVFGVGLALALLGAPRFAAADATHGAGERVAYLERALAALRATPPAELQQATDYAHVLNRSSCASAVERLKIECLMTASRQYCKKRGSDAQRCAADMDVVVSRMLGDAQRISTEQRYQIMTHYKDYRRELARESRRLAGALAVEFRLQMGDAANDAELARKLDQYCLDQNDMPWQTCASSLLWFIVTETSGSAP